MNAYPPNWNDIALQMKIDAGWLCEHCNHPQKAYMLSVLHLNGDKADCRYENMFWFAANVVIYTYSMCTSLDKRHLLFIRGQLSGG